VPSHRFAQLQQQFLFVFRQIASERQRVGGVVGAEDGWLRRLGPLMSRISRIWSMFFYPPQFAATLAG